MSYSNKLKEGLDMDLQTAIERWSAFFQFFNTEYGLPGQPLFDEFLVIEVLSGGNVRLKHYYGPREFQKIVENLAKEAKSLKKDLFDKQQQLPGHCVFDHHATNSDYDAFVVIGRDVCVLLNNIQLSMEEVKKKFPWMIAQKSFLDFVQSFACDPVLL